MVRKIFASAFIAMVMSATMYPSVSVKSEVCVSKQEHTKEQIERTYKTQREVTASRSGNRRKEVYTVTFYTANCKGCSGFTRWEEYDVRNTIYYGEYRIVATDPSIIPPYSIIEFELKGEKIKAIALDTGSAIKGNRIDLLVETKEEAYKLGKQRIEVDIIKTGK